MTDNRTKPEIDAPEGPAPQELVIPPHLAYGPAGGHFLGGKTLIFVIDLVAVG